MKYSTAADRAWVPWKNGGGKTVQVAVYPEAADMDGFVWRISIATVTQAGPFSVFPGIDRTLAILEGNGLVLGIGEQPPVVLTSRSEPMSFAADQPVMARPVDGAVTDLNVMVRRGYGRHAMRRLAFAAPSRIVIDLPQAVVVWIRGVGMVQTDFGTMRAGAFDAAHEAEPTRWTITADGPALVYVVTFEPVAS